MAGIKTDCFGILTELCKAKRMTLLRSHYLVDGLWAEFFDDKSQSYYEVEIKPSNKGTYVNEAIRSWDSSKGK